MEPYIINQTGDQLQSILNKAIIKAELQTTEDGNQAICFTASDGTSISVTLPEWSKRIEYLLQNTYYLQEGIGCAAFDYAMSLGGVTIQSEEVTRQDGDSIILDTSANRFVLERRGKFYPKFLSNGASLQGSDTYISSRNTFLNRQDESYWYRKEDGTLSQGSSTFVIGNWLKTLQSESDSTQETAETARTAAQKAQTTAAALLQDTPWEGRHMNAFTVTGEYHIHGERTNENDGLPILNAGSGHTINARLTVLDSSLTNGTGAKTDIVVTQILRLSNRMGGDGHVYVRTAQAANKSQLATPSSTAWGTWEKLMGMFEKNAVKNIAELDTYTTNGMYSGLFQFENVTSAISGGVEMFTGSTFLMITVNGYAVAKAGLTPQLTQMLYLLPAKDFNATAKMYLRTAYWNKDADPKAWVWANWDRLATASEISGGGGGSIEEYNRLIELISANTAKISSVEITANSAKSSAETAQTAANAAQETANSARETATAASTDAQEAKTAADNANNLATEAQSTATAAQTKNTEQDARLDNIEARIDPDIAGRVWNEDNGTPKAESYYGSVKALRDLPKRLGLGRYLVKDDRTRRKLDPNDSTKYLDGTPAALDGTDGQCMWCWNGFYANVWHEGSRLIKAVTFDGPVGNDISIWIPAGGISWLGAGVMDRTEQKLCSVISDDERYRGGGGNALDASKYTKAPADTTPQITMLGMPATNISTTNFGTYARKRGEGWEANWFVARFVVEFLFEIIMGTENSQEAFNSNKDANGLYQGGFGTGVTDMPDWGNYNGTYPVIPTSVGLEAGDGVCLVEYTLPDASGGTYKTFNVPVFFGLVGAGFGCLLQWTRGLIMDAGENQSLVYVSPSMYAAYDPNTVSDKIMVAECPRVSGWITRKSYKGLCCMPTAIGGSSNVRYSDQFYTSAEKSKGLRVRAAGGGANFGTNAGASCTNAYSAATGAGAYYSAPLCYFDEDPKIPLSQSIATNN